MPNPSTTRPHSILLPLTPEEQTQLKHLASAWGIPQRKALRRCLERVAPSVIGRAERKREKALQAELVATEQQRQ